MRTLDPDMTDHQFYDALEPHEKLRIWRRRMQINRKQAARTFKVGTWTYGRMERGEVPIPDLPWHGPRVLTPAERCQAYRLRAGVTQEHVAAELGVSKVWVVQMENGGQKPDKLLDYWEC
jgi:DNA-binding XRE family transcriptional regulator